MSQGPSFWPSLVIRVGLCPPSVESPAVFGHSLAGAIEWIIARHSDAFLRHSGHIPLLSNFSICRPVAGRPYSTSTEKAFLPSHGAGTDMVLMFGGGRLRIAGEV